MRPLLAILAVLIAAAPAAANPWLERRPLHIAHQGGEIEAPSNTLYAFDDALGKGADVLEMDVHLTADGHVVVLHDETVDRTTDGTGSVEGMTLAQVKALDAAHWFVPGCGTCHGRDPGAYTLRGEGITIPTLEEVLDRYPDVLLNVELKQTIAMTGRLELAVAELLRRFGRDDDVIVVSFLDHSILLFKAIAPEVSTATATAQVAIFKLSAEGPLPGLPNPLMHALQVPVEQSGIQVVNEDFVRDAHANALAVHVWTINDRAEMESLLALGVDGIMTDRPSVLEDVLSG